MLTIESAARKDRTTGASAELQHRHFAFIAAVIAAMPSHAASLRAQKSSVANSFAEACARTNPRFDRRRFMKACGETADA